VPAGTFSVTGSSSVGTSTVVPSIAAVSGTLTLVVTLRPRRSKRASGDTWTSTRGHRRGPLRAGIALALEFDALSVMTPAGMRSSLCATMARVPCRDRSGRASRCARRDPDRRTDTRHGERSLVVVQDASSAAAFAGDETGPGAAPLPLQVDTPRCSAVHRRRHAHDRVANPKWSAVSRSAPRWRAGVVHRRRAAEEIAQVSEVTGLEVESTGARTAGPPGHRSQRRPVRDDGPRRTPCASLCHQSTS